MRTMTNKMRKDSGYTLIELAIGIMIIGLLLAPALYLYGQKLAFDKEQQTKDAIWEARNALGSFVSAYGRFPCPAPVDIGPGNPNYGFEDCTGTAPGIVTATSASVNPALTDKNIYIGSLPFRQMNMQESQSYDGYGDRLTYAVTVMLTSSGTFVPGLGGISVEDVNGNSVLGTPDSAPFVVVSHGKENEGARTRSGVLTGACLAGPIEAENCNDDEVFLDASPRVGYDDVLIHDFSATELAYWKYSSSNSQNVELTQAVGFGVGNSSPADFATSSAGTLNVFTKAANDAVMLASGGAFQSDNLCNYDGSNCFPPSVIGGQIAASKGMACPTGEFLVAIENGAPVCKSEIFISCPSGQFITGIKNGKIECSANVSQCPAQNVTTSCGSAASIGPKFDGEIQDVRDGRCYNLANFTNTNKAYITNNVTTFTDLENYIASLNSAARNQGSCDLIRDNYQCTGTTWGPAAVPHQEIYNYRKFPRSYTATGNYANHFDVGVGPDFFDTANYMTSDPNNTQKNHDCWCREDYYVQQTSCPSGAPGFKYNIYKHRCPQTDQHYKWTWVYGSDEFCGCVDTTSNSSQRCDSYYSVSRGSISGRVQKTTYYTCDGAGNSILDTGVSPNPQEDTSACICPNNAPSITTRACPSGTTNSFSYNGKSYTGISEVRTTPWVCPEGAGLPVSGAAGAGYADTTTIYDPASDGHPCVCDSSLTKTEHENCPAGYSGAGYDYNVKWDCTLNSGAGDWEPQSSWTLIPPGDCSKCVWRTGGGISSSQDTMVGPAADDPGEDCTCGATKPCHTGTAGAFTNYSSCTCSP